MRVTSPPRSPAQKTFLEIDGTEDSKQEFADFCRQQYSNNDVKLKIIDEFESNYQLHSPAWWYTKEVFMYSVLKQALRTQDIDTAMRMRFFIRDLHRQIELFHAEAHHDSDPVIVYRGQDVSKHQFEKMMNSKDGLLAFNSFLSTSTDRQVSLAFADSTCGNLDLTRVLF